MNETTQEKFSSWDSCNIENESENENGDADKVKSYTNKVLNKKTDNLNQSDIKGELKNNLKNSEDDYELCDVPNDNSANPNNLEDGKKADNCEVNGISSVISEDIQSPKENDKIVSGDFVKIENSGKVNI